MSELPPSNGFQSPFSSQFAHDDASHLDRLLELPFPPSTVQAIRQLPEANRAIALLNFCEQLQMNMAQAIQGRIMEHLNVTPGQEFNPDDRARETSRLLTSLRRPKITKIDRILEDCGVLSDAAALDEATASQMHRSIRVWGEVLCIFSPSPLPVVTEHEQTQEIAVLADRKPPRPVACGDSRSLLVRDLQLFSWHPGAVIHGTLEHVHVYSATQLWLREPTEAGSGIFTVFLSYRLKDWVIGSDVTVHDPYYKIDTSGARNIRVDSPMDIFFRPPQRSIGDNGEQKESNDLKYSGDRLLRDGDAAGALAAYEAALVKFPNIAVAATLLSNAAQAHLNVGASLAAAVCAAASLTLHPSNAKAERRYAIALKAPDCVPDDPQRRLVAMMTHAFDGCGSSVEANNGPSDDGDVPDWASTQRLHADGNSAFAAADFGKAIAKYERALRHFAPLAKLLSKMNFAATRFHLWEESVALAAALSAIIGRSKSCDATLAVLRRKNYHRACVSMRHLLCSSPAVFDELRARLSPEEREEVDGALASLDFSFDCFNPATVEEAHLTEYVHPSLVVGDSVGRGRGLFLTSQVRPGEVLLCSRALLECSHEEVERRTNPHSRRGSKPQQIFTTRYANLSLKPGEDALIAEWRQLCALRCFSRKQRCLLALGAIDPKYEAPPSYALSPPLDFPLRLDLPRTAAAGFDLARAIEITFSNSFVCDLRLRNDSVVPAFAVFGTASLLNHASFANCYRWFHGDFMIVVAGSRPIAAGTEVTVSYVPVPICVVCQSEKWKFLPSIPASQRAIKVQLATHLSFIESGFKSQRDAERYGTQVDAWIAAHRGIIHHDFFLCLRTTLAEAWLKAAKRGGGGGRNGDLRGARIVAAALSELERLQAAIPQHLACFQQLQKENDLKIRV